MLTQNIDISLARKTSMVKVSVCISPGLKRNKHQPRPRTATQ